MKLKKDMVVLFAIAVENCSPTVEVRKQDTNGPDWPNLPVPNNAGSRVSGCSERQVQAENGRFVTANISNHCTTKDDPTLPFPIFLGTAGMYWKRTFSILISTYFSRFEVFLPTISRND